MARKKKHPEHENLERWLVSYADFITLLFATFTALYALAQTDAAKLKDVGAAIREGFAEQSIINGIKSILEGKSAPNENPDPISSDKGAGPGVIGKFDSMTYQPGEVKSTQHLVDDLTSDLRQLNRTLQRTGSLDDSGHGPTTSPSGEKGPGAAGQGAAGTIQGASESGAGPAEAKNTRTAEKDQDEPIREISLAFQQRGIRVSFDSRLLFEAGSASLKPGGLKFLDVVAQRLKKFDNHRFHIEGHTDSEGISSLVFPSNWELSAGRASRVVRYLIDRHQFNPASLVAVGYGSTQPIGDNHTAEGRSRNRRVDIILYTAEESMRLNPRIQFLGERPINVHSSTALPPAKPASSSPSDSPANLNRSAKTERLPSSGKPDPNQPIRIIIKEKNGSEQIWMPGQPPPAALRTDAPKPEKSASTPTQAPRPSQPTASKSTSHVRSPARQTDRARVKPPVPGHAE